MLENAHLLRKLYIRHTSDSLPLHFSQIAIMRMIGQHENCTQTMIADCLGVTPSSVATSTKRLQKAGLITKTVDPDNLRCKHLALTEKGRSAIKQQIELFKDYDERIFSDFPDEEKEQLMQLLEKLISRMKEVGGISAPSLSPIELSCYLRKAIDSSDN